MLVLNSLGAVSIVLLALVPAGLIQLVLVLGATCHATMTAKDICIFQIWLNGQFLY